MDHTISSNADQGNRREHEVRFPDKFWRRATHVSIDAKALYAVLATFADYQTGETFVSNTRLQLETGWCVRKIKDLLGELEQAGFIKRWQQMRGNLRSRRHIRCVKYVTSAVQKMHLRPGGAFFGRTEKVPIICTPVKSPVTPEEKKNHLYHTQDHGLLEVPEKRCKDGD
jgi:hypothetical protein